MKQNGLAPVVIIILIAVALGVSGYLIYKPKVAPVPSFQKTIVTSPSPSPSSKNLLPMVTKNDETLTPELQKQILPWGETANWKTHNYSVKGLELTFRYPSNWEQFPQGEGGGVSFHAPDYNQLDGTISIEPLLPQKTFQTVCNNEIKNARQWPWIDIKETQTKIDDVPATILKGKVGYIDDKVHDRLYAVLMDEKRCVRVDALSYNNPSQQAIFDQILSTFKFLP